MLRTWLVRIGLVVVLLVSAGAHGHAHTPALPQGPQLVAALASVGVTEANTGHSHSTTHEHVAADDLPGRDRKLADGANGSSAWSASIDLHRRKSVPSAIYQPPRA